MGWIWTLGGTCFGYRDGDKLWDHEGHNVGTFQGDEVYGLDGHYLGEIKDNLLIQFLEEGETQPGMFVIEQTSGYADLHFRSMSQGTKEYSAPFRLEV